MVKRISDYRYKGYLLTLAEDVDEDDRPITIWKKGNTIFFSELGITATDQFVFVQDKTNVTRKIAIRYDKNLVNHRKDYKVLIDDIAYTIERIYTDMPNERMELSLAYVD